MLILYNPPSNAQRKPILPMSLLALGALLEGHHDYLIVDGNLAPDPLVALDRAIRETGATVLGVSVMPGPQLTHAVPTCRELKRRYPQLTVVWGGYFPTQHWDVCLRAPYVDYVVRGHGEVVFKGLLDTLQQGEDPSGLPGLAWKTGAERMANGEWRMGESANGEWANRRTSADASLTGRTRGHPATAPDAVGMAPATSHQSPLAPIPHPDRLPDFPYHRVEVERYVRSTFLGSRTLPHHSSYGCPFFCNFCAVVNMVNGRWLAQSAERTATTVRKLVERWGVNAVEFYDNNFFTSEARVAEFAQRIVDLDVAWWGEARIDTMLKYSERTWALLRDSGLKMVFLGAESGSDETLQRMNKGGKASTEKTLELARQMAHYGIVPEMSFVLGNPPDPEADVHQTMRFIRRVKETNPATEIIMYMYTPVPLAGELYEQAKGAGFRFPETLEEWIGVQWQDFSQRRSSTLPWIKDPLRQQVEDFERVLNAYYPTTTNPGLRGAKRSLLRTASAWRYRLGFYRFPVELRALHKLVAYQRPETTGF